MLRTRSGLSGSVVKWMSQVAASVGATLVATLIYSALPKAAMPVAVPQLSAVERSESLAMLTSGGKFAARAVSAAPEADERSDAVPVPHLATMAFLAAPDQVTAVGSAMPKGDVRQAMRDGAAPERAARSVRPSRAPVRAEPKRATAEPVSRAPIVASPSAADSTSDAAGDDGVMPRVVSAARGAWTLTAAAGGSLMARVIPLIP